MRRQKQSGEQNARFPGAGKGDQPFPLRTVSGLIVILNKVDKKLRRLSGAGHAAGLPGLRRKLTLVDKSLGQRPC